ncbi:hypothetical protein HDU96_004735 [Phlyctochytrium bullatum]|nr:hypothetical protein HDU96_004735 [Phlyctochytrium bullatum]
MAPSGVLKFDVVGTGANLGDEGTIYAEAGWGVPSQVEAAVHIKSTKVLKELKITVELRGMIETRWSGNKPMVPGDILPTRFAKRFLHLTEVVRDKKEALQPNEFGMITLPFKMTLPPNGLPPTYSDRASTISYYFKVIIAYQDGMKLMKTHKELEIPIIVRMPESTRIHLLTSPSPIDHNPPPSPDKCGYSVHIPHRAFQPGDVLEADVTVFSSPQNAIVRSVAASVRTSIEYTGQDMSAKVSLAKPLAEAAEAVGGSVSQKAWTNRFSLRLDPAICRATLESPLINVKSYFFLEIFLKGSDAANITIDLPIVIVPVSRGEKNVGTTSQVSRGSMSSEVPNTPPALGPGLSPSSAGSNISSGVMPGSAPGSVVSVPFPAPRPGPPQARGARAPARGAGGPPPPPRAPGARPAPPPPRRGLRVPYPSPGLGPQQPLTALPPSAHDAFQQQQQQQQALYQMYQMQLAYQLQQQQHQQPPFSSSQSSVGVPTGPPMDGYGANMSRSMSERAPRVFPTGPNGAPPPAMGGPPQPYGAPAPQSMMMNPSQPGMEPPNMMRRAATNASAMYGNAGYQQQYMGRPVSPYQQQQQPQQGGQWDPNPPPRRSGGSIVDGGIRSPQRPGYAGPPPAYGQEPLSPDWQTLPSPSASTAPSTVPSSIDMPDMTAEGMLNNMMTAPAGQYGNPPPMPMGQYAQPPDRRLSRMPTGAAPENVHNLLTSRLGEAGGPSSASTGSSTTKSSALDKMDALLNALSATIDEAQPNPNPNLQNPPPPSAPLPPVPATPTGSEIMPTPPASPGGANLPAAGAQVRRTIKEPKRYRVIAEYVPQLDDELELFPGQVMIIRKIYGDGWASGLNLSTGKEGTFPLQNIEAL